MCKLENVVVGIDVAKVALDVASAQVANSAAWYTPCCLVTACLAVCRTPVPGAWGVCQVNQHAWKSRWCCGYHSHRAPRSQGDSA